MGRDDFYKNSFMLTASNLTTGILGFIFSMYLSKILGPEGMGLYGIIMPIYNLFISIMTAGIIAAISKITAVYSGENDYNNIIRTMKVVAMFNFIWCFIIGIFVFFLSPIIGHFWAKDPRIIKAIMVTCPAMIFIALSNILKGFFYGTSKITVPSFIDILEKSLRIVVLAILIFIFKAETLESLVTLAYLALCLGELQSLILLFGYFKYTVKRVPKKNTKGESRAQLLFDVLVTSVPLCLNGFLMSIFSVISTLLVPKRLMVAGFTYAQALSLIGKYSAMAMSIVTFPIIIVSSINTMLIPDLSQTLSRKHYNSAAKRIRDVIKIAFLIGVCTTVLGLCIPDALGKVFFGRDDLGEYIRVTSLIMPIVFTSNTMYGILNGLGKQNIILRNTVVTEILEVSSLFFLTAIPSINIYGYAITMLLVSSLSLCLNIYEIFKSINIGFSISNLFIYTLTGVLTYICLSPLSLTLSYIDYRLQALVITFIAVLIFSILILKDKIFSHFKRFSIKAS
ncbi:stage V sporulation protein B [Clostridium sp. B9]|uniref:stage V sporulation protein B n=1 Tax=Clostridium sp. B9 TaxID=3423224 RepID=UPI003D2EF51C